MIAHLKRRLLHAVLMLLGIAAVTTSLVQRAPHGVHAGRGGCRLR